MKKTLALLLALIIALTGCGSKEQATPAQSTVEAPVQTATQTAETTEVTLESGETRTVTDMAGRTVTLPKKIERIGTFGSVGVLNAFVELMGDGSKIVNQMPANFTKNDAWKMQYEFAPQIAQGPLFESDGKEILIEEVIKSKIDVCFTMTKETATLLEDNNVACVYLDWNDVNDVKTAVTLMGEVLNKEETAKKYIAYIDATLAKATELMKNISDADKKTVLYGNPIEFTQPHIIAEWWIAQAGGKSVTDNGRTENRYEYTMEDLLKWNPQVMIVSNKKLVEEIKANPNYAGITAVKDDAFHVIPTVAHVWGNRTVEQPLTVYWTMHHLYPEIMPRDELSKEITTFYKDFFLYDMSEEQVADIIDR